MCYLKGISNHGLLNKGRPNLKSLPEINVTSHGYYNVNWASDIDKKKIYIRICFYFIFRSCKFDQQKEDNNYVIFFLK
jgi:hypothetical protein